MDATMQTTNTNDPSAYLAPGRYVDSDHPAVIAFARRVADPAMTPREIAVKLYYAVRDEFLYDPYYFDITVEGLKGSRVIEAGRGFCVQRRRCWQRLPVCWACRHGWAMPTFATT